MFPSLRVTNFMYIAIKEISAYVLQSTLKAKIWKYEHINLLYYNFKQAYIKDGTKNFLYFLPPTLGNNSAPHAIQ